uniref:Uncharacterized protein n=1 Tax=Balaenoptera musculus TaxID=9771 RepID=A0A8C0DFC6_BALMU
VHALDDVTAVVEHTANVLCVHSAGEVRVAIVAPVSTSSADSLWKFISNEVLGPGHAWVLSGLGSRSSKFWKVVLNLRFSSKDFLSEQILLVEEQNHRDGTGGSPHKPVVPDALEEVQGLLQAVGLVVFPDDHVVAAAGNHKDDGSHIFALDPFAAFITLAAHGTIYLLEVDFIHLELGLKDSRSQDAAAPCAYLVAGHIVSLLDDVNLVQELVLVGALVAGTHPLVLPQSLGVGGGLAYGREIKVWHIHHAQNVVHSELVLGVGQLHGGHQVAHGGPGTYFNGLFQVVFDVLHFGGLLTTVGLKRKKKIILHHADSQCRFNHDFPTKIVFCS